VDGTNISHRGGAAGQSSRFVEKDRIDGRERFQLEPGHLQKVIPTVSQEMLAKMIGTRRSRVNFLMNKFRKLASSSTFCLGPFVGRILTAGSTAARAVFSSWLPGTNRSVRVEEYDCAATLRESTPET
jgi:hypothetical protein